MARNRRNHSKRPSKYGDYNKVKARTEKMNASVRLAVCMLAFTACLAFVVAALQPYRELNRLKADLADVQSLEAGVAGRKDAKERELRAVKGDKRYLEIIARDRLNYYRPGEHVFRIERHGGGGF